MSERDARGKAADAVDERARRRAAAAAAQQELTPEAIALEAERQRVNAALLHGGDGVVAEAQHLVDEIEATESFIRASPDNPYGKKVLEPSPPLPVDDNGDFEVSHPTEPSGPFVGVDGWPGPGETSMSQEQWSENAQQHDETLSQKLAEAVQPLVDEEGEEEPVGIGRAVIQWVLVNAEDGYELGLQVQVDEQPPGGVVLDISREMLDRWSAGVGLQKNRVEHKHFCAGIIEKAVELAATETANALIYTLEALMLEPTRTAVGEDEA